MAAYGGHVPPFKFPSPVDVGIHVHVQVQTSFERIRRLDQIVDLTPAYLLRFHRYKYAVFFELLPNTSFYPNWSEASIVESIDHESFFDYYSNFPVENGDYFFDAQDNEPETLSPDLFQIDSLASPVIEVDCRHTTDGHLPTNSQAPSATAQVFLTQTSATQDFFSFGTIRHPVIFDSGASLGITFDKTILMDPCRNQREIFDLEEWHQDYLLKVSGPYHTHSETEMAL